ncbi:hypothetical protein DFH06DRAFT_1346856 [Mycena polygramma]|nr:hypothetical protein DFH06DRAFT_1346856 [Mycena polygramma]
MATNTLPLTTLDTVRDIEAAFDFLAANPNMSVCPSVFYSMLVLMSSQQIPGFTRALFIGTGMDEPLIVRVPRPTPQLATARDLDVQPWLVPNPAHWSPTVRTFEASMSIDTVGHFFIVGPAQDWHPMDDPTLQNPANNYVSKLRLPTTKDFTTGNILVVRVAEHTGRPLDVLDSDAAAVMSLVIGFASNNVMVGARGAPGSYFIVTGKVFYCASLDGLCLFKLSVLVLKSARRFLSLAQHSTVMATTTLSLTTERTIVEIEGRFDQNDRRLPPRHGFLNAFFIGTGMDQPRIVRVPRTRHQPANWKELDLRSWLVPDPALWAHEIGVDGKDMLLHDELFCVMGTDQDRPFGVANIVHPPTPSSAPPADGRPLDVRESDRVHVLPSVLGLVFPGASQILGL